MDFKISLIMTVLILILITALNIVLKKNNKRGWQHYFVGYFFLIYIVACLILVGIPSVYEWKVHLIEHERIFNPHLNLIPLKDGLDISNILNIILFMPFGFLNPIMWTKYQKFKNIFLYGLFFTFFIEFSQLFTTARTTDIDDIIMNTIGNVLGFIIFNIMKKIFHKFIDKSAVESSSKDMLLSRLEPYLYLVIPVIFLFLQ
ncbi:VanZ family protein [Clostridium felsineum]|uniref:Uncharacterized protein n=1 Tax=Clostridium felsineum TaxID=36839 RepID=A0A1S8L3B0_9CLOT|nr:VanZ family protein [Clostridium felsineum]URZ07584.1 hypothetical protein CLROS_029230 [Clostridium felsineum]URZ12615.1 hypothetical protein CROST_033380 [Clostridium felsineum]